jgi:heat shock protein HtpX
LFDTHPPIEKRIEALIKFAGGHDPGPLALPGESEPDDSQSGPWGGSDQTQGSVPDTSPRSDPASGPWGQESPPEPSKPFLPERPPIELGSSRPQSDQQGGAGGEAGPWGPRRSN